MSRNFDLSTGVEFDARAAVRRLRVADDALPKAPVSRVAYPPEMLPLVQGLFLSTAGGNLNQVVFCGVDEENGSSIVCASAGRTLSANCIGSVCLVDANVYSASLSRLFGIERQAAFSVRARSLRERCMQVEDNLWVAEPSALAGSGPSFPMMGEMKERLAQLRLEFDYLLFDVAGTSVASDAAILGQAVGGVVLVIEANITRRVAARKALQMFDAAGVRLLGTVLQNRSLPIPPALYKKL